MFLVSNDDLSTSYNKSVYLAATQVDPSPKCGMFYGLRATNKTPSVPQPVPGIQPVNSFLCGLLVS